MKSIEPLLERLVAELAGENTVAITLTGSYARGDATPYSDVDIIHYVRQSPDHQAAYTLRYAGDVLVSLTTLTLDERRADLARPESVLWCVSGLQQARVLYDPQGMFAALLAEADAVVWDAALQARADAYAGYELAGYAEEAHKILGGLMRADDSQTLYAVYGMVLGISRIVAAQRGIVVESDNVYFQRLQEAMGASSEWTRLFRGAAGLEPGTVRMRGSAALELYAETARLLDEALLPEHRAVIERAVEVIKQSQFDTSML